VQVRCDEWGDVGETDKPTPQDDYERMLAESDYLANQGEDQEE